MTRKIKPTFLPWLHEAIPLTGHLGINRLAWQEQTLVAELELAPLVNDKGTGFGGGVAGLATLLGWCYVTLLLDEQGQVCPVVVKESCNHFTAPITADFSMHCWCEEPSGVEAFLQEHSEYQRANIQLRVEVRQGDRVAFHYQGSYVSLGNRQPG